MKSHFYVLLVSLVLALVMLSPVAVAEPAAVASPLARYKPVSKEALERFDAGNSDVRHGVDRQRGFVVRVRDLEHAIAEYQAGRALEDAPAFDYNLAQAYRALGRNADAIEHLQRFRERVIAEHDAQTRAFLDRELDEVDPSGELRAALGNKSAAAGPTAPAAGPIGRRLVEPSVASPTVGPAGAQQGTVTDQPQRSRWRRVGWLMAGAGAAGGGVAIGLLVSESSLRHDGTDAMANPMESVRADLVKRADSRRLAGAVVGAASGALLITGVVLALRRGNGDASSTQAAWMLGVSGRGVTVAGRF